MSAESLLVTEVDGTTATWSITGRSVRVHRIRWPDGVETVLDPPQPLGACFEVLPRELWDEILRRYTLRRPAP